MRCLVALSSPPNSAHMRARPWCRPSSKSYTLSDKKCPTYDIHMRLKHHSIHVLQPEGCLRRDTENSSVDLWRKPSFRGRVNEWDGLNETYRSDACGHRPCHAQLFTLISRLSVCFWCFASAYVLCRESRARTCLQDGPDVNEFRAM